MSMKYTIFCLKRLVQICLTRYIIRPICYEVTLQMPKWQTGGIYGFIFRQSFIKQQSIYEHWPPDLPKHGVHPSAIWIECIRSAFFIFPGVIPSALAFVFISGIPNRFSAVFVNGIYLTPSNFPCSSKAPRRFL